MNDDNYDPEGDFNKAVRDIRYGGAAVGSPYGQEVKLNGSYTVDTLRIILEALEKYIEATTFKD